MKRILPLLLLLLPFFCAAENLFPEWEKECKEEKNIAPAQWRTSSWGGKEKALFQWKVASDRLVLFCKNPSESGTCALFHSLQLPQTKEGEKRTFRFSATVRGGKPALILLLLSSNHDTKRCYGNSSADLQSFSVELTVPAKSRKLSVALYLYGKGEVEFSGLRLEEITKPPEVQINSNLFERTFEIGERVPGTATMNFYNLAVGGKVRLKLRLPRGYRLSSNSWYSLWEVARPLPGGESEYLLSSKEYTGSKWSLLLQIESLLPPSPGAAWGELEVDAGNGVRIHKKLSFRTVPAVQATAPRKFSAGFCWSGMLSPDEALPRLQEAMQFSGANFILGAHSFFVTLSQRPLRRFVWISTPTPLRGGICKYAGLRNETFWGKRFFPPLRHMDPKTTDLIAPVDLGQKEALFCLCPLCRAEFSDFAPKLPPRRIMNLSAGQLQHYYGKELRAFRTARWQNLLEAVQLHLGDGTKKFVRTPRFWPLINVLSFTQEIEGIKRLRRAVIRMENPTQLIQNDDFPHSLTLFFLAEQARKRFPKAELLALLPPAPPELLCSAQYSEFVFTAIWAAGFDGFCADLQQGADYRNYAGFAAAVKRIHAFESWQYIPLEQAGIQLECKAEKVSLPVIPAYGRRNTVPLPSEHSPVVAACRRQGKELLVLVGNFGFDTQQCTIKAPGCTPSERTITIAPQHWEQVLLHRP